MTNNNQNILTNEKIFSQIFNFLEGRKNIKNNFWNTYAIFFRNFDFSC